MAVNSNVRTKMRNAATTAVGKLFDEIDQLEEVLKQPIEFGNITLQHVTGVTAEHDDEYQARTSIRITVIGKAAITGY